MTINYTPRTWVAGETVTAAFMNTETRDALTGVQAAWTAYTPTWTASVNPVLNNGTLLGAYLRLGKTIVGLRIQLTPGSTTTYGSGNWAFALPAAAHAGYTANMHLGNGLGTDTSVPAFSTLTAGWLGASSIFVLAGTGTTALQATQPWTWAVSDKMALTLSYELA